MLTHDSDYTGHYVCFLNHRVPRFLNTPWTWLDTPWTWLAAAVSTISQTSHQFTESWYWRRRPYSSARWLASIRLTSSPLKYCNVRQCFRRSMTSCMMVG